jgi:hypothetical protein
LRNSEDHPYRQEPERNRNGIEIGFLILMAGLVLVLALIAAAVEMGWITPPAF